MATNGHFDPEAKYAQLGERVDNQGSRISQLESVVSRGFADVGSQIKGISDEIRGNSKTQWPVILSAVAVSWTVLGGLGIMALQPVRESQAETKSDVRAILEKMVTRSDIEQRATRSLEDRTRMEGAIGDLRKDQVPRAELERVWDGYNQRFVDQQRQIDAMAATNGSTYTPRDVLLDLKSKQERIEAEINRLRGVSPTQ